MVTVIATTQVHASVSSVAASGDGPRLPHVTTAVVHLQPVVRDVRHFRPRERLLPGDAGVMYVQLQPRAWGQGETCMHAERESIWAIM